MRQHCFVLSESYYELKLLKALASDLDSAQVCSLAKHSTWSVTSLLYCINTHLQWMPMRFRVVKLNNKYFIFLLTVVVVEWELLLMNVTTLPNTEEKARILFKAFNGKMSLLIKEFYLLRKLINFDIFLINWKFF